MGEGENCMGREVNGMGSWEGVGKGRGENMGEWGGCYKCATWGG